MKTKIKAILPVFALWQREMTRFYRDRSRVIGGMLPPVIFWFFIGSGLGNSFNAGDSSNINYLQYFFPGTLTLIFWSRIKVETWGIFNDFTVKKLGCPKPLSQGIFFIPFGAAPLPQAVGRRRRG